MSVGVSLGFFYYYCLAFSVDIFFISLPVFFSLLARDIYRVLVLNVDGDDRGGPGYFLGRSFCSQGLG